VRAPIDLSNRQTDPGFRRDDAVEGVSKADRPSRLTYLYLVIILVTWAVNWPLMKIALTDAQPQMFVVARLTGTIAVLLPVLLVTREPLLPVRGERLGLTWVGLLQVAGFLITSIIGLRIVPAGRAIVLAYTMPLWAIPIGLWLWREPIGRWQLFGAALGFVGLVLFMNPGLIDWDDGRVLAGNAMLILAAIFWALGSCLYRQRKWASPFWTQTFWQLAISTVALAALAWLPAGKTVNWTASLIVVLVYNWVVTTALGYFLWAKVLAVMPAAVAGQVLALTPIGGFLLSALIFGGAVSIDVVAAIVLIVAGISLSLRKQG
jgi:drug/metabolite transporter (DMT)-like permease